MFRHFSRLPPALFALLLSPHLSAQSDFGVWAEADAQFKISKKWNVGIDAGLRTRSGLSAFDRWSIGASAEFEPVKFLSAVLSQFNALLGEPPHFPYGGIEAARAAKGLN